MEKFTSFQQWIQDGTVSIPAVLLKNYSSLGINEEECMMLIHIHAFVEKGKTFPTPDELAERMSLSSPECFFTIQRMIKKGLLSISESQAGDVREESYSLMPLWNALIDKLSKEKHQEKIEAAMNLQTDLYTLFEQEFGRPLSPLECETLAMWIDQDHQTTELIKAALREAVISNKLNFRYIDRILFEWKKQGIQTVEQAKRQGEKFRQPKKQEYTRETEETRKVPFYNWLEK
ncbi:DnaD domain-containing protein [Jeotgalibacillus proteolyticus]|uniref:DNA replication protein DnaD n=1 Tax=Jeotgalibacillus proteolyticus TaxID=2082395 RepID=A0A2S5GED5_9BACL|nr:DnaD domain-containing protein [Jeotgalibacillus proteolyticus]PPA71233.1 DNA replication protein DnaD [Jeotgalibacillus proteolyticus]